MKPAMGGRRPAKGKRSCDAKRWLPFAANCDAQTSDLHINHAAHEADLKSAWEDITWNKESTEIYNRRGRAANHPQKRSHKSVWVGCGCGLQVEFCCLSRIVVWVENSLRKHHVTGKRRHRTQAPSNREARTIHLNDYRCITCRSGSIEARLHNS